MTNNSSPSYSAGRADVRKAHVSGDPLKGAFPAFVCKKRVPGDLLIEHATLWPKIESIARTPEMAAAVIAEMKGALTAVRKARDTALAQLDTCSRESSAAEAQIEELRSECELLQQENEQLAELVAATRGNSETPQRPLPVEDDTDSLLVRFDSESLARNAAEHLDDIVLPTPSNDARPANGAWETQRDKQEDEVFDADLVARLMAVNEKRDAAKRALRL